MERATLKIEIPFTDHAHCIGRQGNQIQNIMSTTDTHIHFPDENREPNRIKSNQVSITGSIISIKKARKSLQDILPMSLKFLLPSNYINDHYSLFQNVQRRFGVIVLSRTYAKTDDAYCIVRGLINQPNLAEATEYLIQLFYGFESTFIKVTCEIEVSEQYYIYLQTRQQSKDMCITSIEQYTHTTIQFPMTNRRTSVIITGLPTQVCQARKLFDLCLPIILIFELPIDKQQPTRTEIAYIENKLNVTTIIRTRKDKIVKLINIQTQEYNSEQLFHARSIILNLPISVIDNSSNLDSISIPLTSSSTIITDGLLIPIEPFYLSSTQQIEKKPSPIGHERSSLLRNFDQDKSDTRNISSSTKLFTLLHSINFDQYWSIFKHNEVINMIHLD